MDDNSIGLKDGKQREGDCDKLLFKNGDVQWCKVLEVNSSQVKFKDCDNLDGPTYTKSKFRFAKINYASGIEQRLDDSYVEVDSDEEFDSEKYEKDVNTTGVFIGGIVAGFFYLF